MTPDRWAILLSWALDLLALTSLAGTLEVHPGFFGGALALFALSRLRLERGVRAPVTAGALVLGFLAVFAGALGLVYLAKLHPLIAAASAAPLTHGLLWLAPDDHRLRGWRLALGLLELTLASALTPEVYLPVAIVVFVVLSSAALSCSFLDRELRARAPEQSKLPLPAGFVARSLVAAVLIFLTSAVIFPLLPRMRGGLDLLPGQAESGYTERVDISQWRNLGEGAGGPVLRLYGSGGEELPLEIFRGLLRARVLDRFDGKNWFAGGASPGLPGAWLRALEDSHRTTMIEAVREPVDSDSLPVPYGTRSVWVLDGEATSKLRMRSNGEWALAGAAGRRILYRAAVESNDLRYLKALQDADRPRPEQLEVPPALRDEPMRRLARTLFDHAPTAQEKIARVRAFLSEFRATTGEDEGRLSSGRGRLSALEEFLFVYRAGYCSWFASSAAILLRLAGIPTRLIAGFRVTKAPVGGILTLRAGDAHAWLEAWTEDRGWIPLDPTPRLSAPSPLFNTLRNGYDLLAAYWYRYVVTYGSQRSPGPDGELSFASQSSPLSGIRSWVKREAESEGVSFRIVLALVALSLVGLVLFARSRLLRARLSSAAEGPSALRRERARMERLVRKLSKKDAVAGDLRLSARELRLEGREAAARALEGWLECYERARFGPGGPAPDAAARLRALRASWTAALGGQAARERSA